MQRERGMERRATEGGREEHWAFCARIRTRSRRPTSFSGRVKEKERREGGRRRRRAKLCICRSVGTENQPDTTARGDTTAPPSTTASWMESLIVLVSPPSLQLFFLLRLLFSFGPSSNIRDGKLTVHQEEEKAVEEEALPLARASRRRGGQQGQKSRIGVVRSLVAPLPVPLPTTPLLTLLVAPEREREGRGGEGGESETAGNRGGV